MMARAVAVLPPCCLVLSQTTHKSLENSDGTLAAAPEYGLSGRRPRGNARALLSAILAGVILSGVAVPGLPFAGAAQAAQTCSLSRIDLRPPAKAGQGEPESFSVEIADTAASRAQGLMYRESLAPEAGMLFIYETPRRAEFWMKNTLIPLDIIFADSRGRVTVVHENAVPGDETPIPGGDNVLYVLEINGGLAKKTGIVPGSEMRHPLISAGAWPCR
ncbi:DUF192 domain-containing protein [Pseudomonas sp. GX19020]|uniref:DUF192 domain-containing protein n=1 Tax=Pseudomonas sp. GX19020 TaxID=2942277 RepID=UPI002019F032|nr:DUF192 domain-containing protein [Pseudomonas sp. GX19020]MCL4064978.1 DUF192 domain-containing protein [Pseudomonas sp. GX19020]